MQSNFRMNNTLWRFKLQNTFDYYDNHFIFKIWSCLFVLKIHTVSNEHQSAKYSMTITLKSLITLFSSWKSLVKNLHVLNWKKRVHWNKITLTFYCIVLILLLLHLVKVVIFMSIFLTHLINTLFIDMRYTFMVYINNLFFISNKTFNG